MTRTPTDRLERWFERHARDLPWRRRRSGYTALVAEAMLQQTQVARVLERYPAFLRRFPSVRALAAADEQEVLAAWQGLGYYRRARHLHAAAKVIVADHGGRVPRTAAALAALPGVGRYTAGAIASIVYGERAAIVDGNVARVLARLAADDRPPTEPKTVARRWAEAAALVTEAARPGVVNEALMELGATVCTPAAPRCAACPLARACRARVEGRQGEIPPPKPAPKQQRVHHHAVIVRRAGLILLVRRPDTGLWSGLWQTPTVEAKRALPAARIEAGLGVAVTAFREVAAFDYQTTHRRVRFHVYAARTRARSGTWRRPDDVSDLPMSNAHRRILRLVYDASAGAGTAAGSSGFEVG